MTRDDDTITLKDAAGHFGFTVSTLRAEANRGRLTIYKIGKRFYTTRRDIQAMVEACRVPVKVPASISIRAERHGSSEMDYISSARDALKASLRKHANV